MSISNFPHPSRESFAGKRFSWRFSFWALNHVLDSSKMTEALQDTESLENLEIARRASAHWMVRDLANTVDMMACAMNGSSEHLPEQLRNPASGNMELDPRLLDQLYCGRAMSNKSSSYK